jgi:thioredoxin 1
MPAMHLNQQDFEEKVIKVKIALVDFYAQWCGPCQMAAPIIDKMADELHDTIFIGKVDVDQERELATKYSVQSIPTIIIYKDGKEVDRKIGFPGEDGLRNLVKNYSK